MKGCFGLEVVAAHTTCTVWVGHNSVAAARAYLVALRGSAVQLRACFANQPGDAKGKCVSSAEEGC